MESLFQIEARHSEIEEAQIRLKAELEEYRNKVNMREIEAQNAKDELAKYQSREAACDKNMKNFIMHFDVENKQKFEDVKSSVEKYLKRLIENNDLEDNRLRLEMLVHRLENYLQNNEAKAFLEQAESGNASKSKGEDEYKAYLEQDLDIDLKPGFETEEMVIQKLSEKYQKELSKLSLSQREKMVFNYIHQSSAQEELKDVNPEEVLRVSNGVSEKGEDRKKAIRDKIKRRQQLKKIIENLKKAGQENNEGLKRRVDNAPSNPADPKIKKSKSMNALLEYEEEECSESESSSQSGASEISSSESEARQCVQKRDAKRESLLEKMKESGEIHMENNNNKNPISRPQPKEVAGKYKQIRVSPDILLGEKSKNRPAENRAVSVAQKEPIKTDIPYLEMQKPQVANVKRINKSKITFFKPNPNPNANPNTNEKNPNFFISPHSQIQRDQEILRQKLAVRQSQQPQKVANASFVVNKNYGKQHNELNVNISIVDPRVGNKLRNQVAALFPCRNPTNNQLQANIKNQIPETQKAGRMSARSMSTRSFTKSPCSYRERKNQFRVHASIQKNVSPSRSNISVSNPSRHKNLGNVQYRKGDNRILSQNAHTTEPSHSIENSHKPSNVSVPSVSPNRSEIKEDKNFDENYSKGIADIKRNINSSSASKGGRKIGDRKVSINANNRSTQEAQQKYNIVHKHQQIKCSILPNKAVPIINKIRFREN
jgi:hypothetical protein